MKIRIQKGKAKGYVDAPPSKSMAHRMLICAGLSEGVSVVNNITLSKDILATMDCLEAIGASCRREGDAIIVTGVNPKIMTAKNSLKCKESGSTLRFFIPICLLSESEATLEGSQRLLERPLGVYEDICAEKGMYFNHSSQNVIVKGPISAGEYRLAGNVSSQFVSGLLFALPVIDRDSKIIITPPVESRSYINMTISALNTFGVNVLWEDENTILIPGNQQYKAKDVRVEGDYSNVAFFEALNVLGGEVEIGNLEKDSLQGDKVYKEMFEELKRGAATLNISDCPDLGPILFAVAAAKNGGIFNGAARLKIKESNRSEVMAKELSKFGALVEIEEDTVIVHPMSEYKLTETIYGHNDHRIVMSMAVLLTKMGGIIEGAEAVAKSFPDFFDTLESLGIEVETIED